MKKQDVAREKQPGLVGMEDVKRVRTDFCTSPSFLALAVCIGSYVQINNSYNEKMARSNQFSGLSTFDSREKNQIYKSNPE